MSKSSQPYCPIDQSTTDLAEVKTTQAQISDTDAYRELVNYAPVCIHEIGLDGNLKKMNQAGLDMMGLESESQVMEIPYTSFVGEHNQSWIAELLRKAIAGEPIPNFEFVIDTPEGERAFWSNFIPMLNEQQQVVKIMGVTRETTEEYRAKKALHQLNEDLEDKVKQATQELRASVDELKQTQTQLVESKKMASLAGLIAGVSHEINTPLGIGITAVSTLQAATATLYKDFKSGAISKRNMKKYFDDAKISEQLILSNLNRTAELIKSFKQIAVDQACQEVRVYYVKSYINEVLVGWHHRLRSSKFFINFDVNRDFRVRGAPGAFSQILGNLINNSISHGFENSDCGEINISIVRNKDTVVFSYQDNGRGIEASELELIFEPFYTTKRGQGNTGLGLHILYNCVIQSLKGQVDCQSEVGKGTTFTITFPCRSDWN